MKSTLSRAGWIIGAMIEGIILIPILTVAAACIGVVCLVRAELDLLRSGR